MSFTNFSNLEQGWITKAKKLQKIQLDDGFDGGRQVVSGIAPWYKPEDLVGKQVCFIANLAPRKIKGIESRGMILMAKDESGKMRFVTPAEAVDNGACVG